MFPQGTIRVSKENFYLMHPILKCSRLFGLCPIRFKDQGQFLNLEWSYGYQIYSFVVPGVLCVITLLGLPDNEAQFAKEHDKKRVYLTACDILTITLIVMLCILATPKQMNSFWKICKNFNEIERSLIIRNPKRHRITSILFITTVFCIYTIVYLLDLLTWHANYEKIDCAYTLLKDFIPFYVLKYIMLTEILFFCHLVYFTSFRIVYLVESLKKIIKERIFDVSGFENGEIKVLPPTMTYNMKINDTALRVYQLATVHKKLVETIEIINGTGGFVIVIILFSVMIHLVVSPYFLVSELEKGRNSSMIFVSLQCMWIIAHAGKFFIVMETCNHCGSKSEELFIVVQKLFVQEKVVKTKTALLNLIIQLKLCKTQINILGLFKLDRSLLTGFIAAITTYLVVLLQVV